ncbi:MAG: heme lyase CcmF/NrfE family subunit [Actinomycetota bacterium]|nr:heme lyase CcmF/NrfE family subunit [Actinomycetota bacterium]
MTTIGYFSLLSAAAISAYAVGMSIYGKLVGRKAIIASGERAAIAVGGLLVLSAATILNAFLSHDFSLKYVADYSDRALGTVYLISGFWAGNQGSLLMWAVFLGVFTTIVVIQNQHKNRDLMPWVTAILSSFTFFFTTLIILMANPFEKLPFVPADGQGLNPMLENPGMYLHPPTTYLGYVGFGVPFAFAMAALLSGRLSDVWIRSTRRWTLFAWFFLTIGNLVGAWWAYYTLGWGGYWGWDPVENSSFIPWLIGTAYLHSIMIQEKKGMLKIWNVSLIVLTFSMTIMGTLITRSGIINSVHTFSNSGLGPYLFFLFMATLAFGFGLIVYRLPQLKTENELDSIVSRESTFLFNNLILLGIAFMTLWGTIFPFISEAVRGVKVTVGAPFYDQVAAPLGIALLFLLGLCPMIAWRKASLDNLQRNFLFPLLVSFAGGAVLVAMGMRRPIGALLTAVLIIFVLMTIIIEFYRGAAARHRMTGEGYLTAFINLIWRNKRRYGGYIIHIGAAMIFLAFVGGPFKQQVEETLTPGQSLNIGNYKIVFERMYQYPGAKKITIAADMTLYDRLTGKPVGTVTPRKEFFEQTGGGGEDKQPWTRVAVRSSMKEDVYFIFSPDETGKQAAGFKVMINPLMRWMWIAGFVMTFGTIIVFWPDEGEKKRLALIYAREVPIEA